MKTDQIIMCVVALLLGMLLANMLKNVCGCEIVEGQLGTTSVNSADMLTNAKDSADAAWTDGLCQFERADLSDYSTLDPGTAYENWDRNLVMKGAMRDELNRKDLKVDAKKNYCERPSDQGGPGCVWTTKGAVKAGDDCYEPLPVVHIVINLPVDPRAPDSDLTQPPVQVLADLGGIAKWIISRMTRLGEAERAALTFLGHGEHLKLPKVYTKADLPQVTLKLTLPTVAVSAVDDAVLPIVIMLPHVELEGNLLPYLHTDLSPEEFQALQGEYLAENGH